MKAAKGWLAGLVSIVTVSVASAAGWRTTDEGIWDDAWLAGYGAWLPLVLALLVYLVVWLGRKQKQRKRR